MIRTFLVLAALLSGLAVQAADGIVPGKRFAVPFAVDGKPALNFAVVTIDTAGKATLRVVYAKEGKPPDEKFYWLTPRDQPPPDPIPPDPIPPPPPPPPDTKWQVMFYVESGDLDNLPAGQRDMLASLVFRQGLKAKGHALVGVFDRQMVGPDGKIPERFQAWYRAIEGDPLPRVGIAPLSGGDVLDFPLPANEAALWKLLETGGK